jgi:acyl-CoA reductase-like NAD-dependent aldehyde dehydrogenase
VAPPQKRIGAPDVLEAVYGFGETGSTVVDLVDFIMFTGSVNTGLNSFTKRA